MLRPAYAAAAAAAGLLAGATQAQAQAVGQVSVSAGRIEINGAGHVRTLPCDGRDVAIVGTEHRITLTGVCRSVEISGVDNEVTAAIQPNGRLSVTGTDQKVRWRSAGQPAQAFSGVDNDITRLPAS